MMEAESSFADLNDGIACATAFIQFVVRYVLENHKKDMEFFDSWVEKGNISRLNNVAESDPEMLTYTDAIRFLQKVSKKFEFPVKWGCDLQAEHERYLTMALGGHTAIVRDYPKVIKPFYMRLNDDEKTVAAMDVLVPQIGELIGGGQREERLGHLEARLHDCNLDKQSYQWYLDLRRYGSVPHTGFGVGLDRLMLFVTGLKNIRDVTPFPRTPGSAEF